MRELNHRILHLDIPDRMRRLKISDEGFPVPWFVGYVDGKPDFRTMDGDKLIIAVRHKRCWMCGQPLGKHLTFAIGPMCTVNRNIAAYLEPDDLTKAAEGDVDADAVRSGLAAAGIKLPDADLAGLLPETIQHATRMTARAANAEQLDELKVSRLELPTIADGVDLGSLYELSESLAQQGVR